MTPYEIEKLAIHEKGRAELYKKYLPTFEMVDKYSEQLQNGDLATEYELKEIQQKLTGCYMKLYVVADTVATIKSNFELNYFDKESGVLKKNSKKVNVSEINTQARNASAEYRRLRNMFLRYSIACEKAIITTQSILKKMTNEKGFKSVDHTGEVPQEEKPKKNVTESIFDKVDDTGGWV